MRRITRRSFKKLELNTSRYNYSHLGSKTLSNTESWVGIRYLRRLAYSGRHYPARYKQYSRIQNRI